MTGLRRNLGLVVFALALGLPAGAGPQGELQDQFGIAIDLLQRGRRDEALAALRKIAASSPDQKAAYALWTGRDYADWRDLLVQGGEFELIAKRLIELAAVERRERRNDKDAILALVRTATQSDDVTERRQAVRTLSADHGEYATPYLVPLLADGDEDRRVLAIHALAQLGDDVVVGVTEALKSDDATMRRNACFALGTIGSPLAVGALQRTAASDPDEVVRQAASEALSRLGASGGGALESFLAAGDAYWRRSDTALRRGEAGDVIWSWKDGQLVGTPIPRALYGSEMSKRAFYDALSVDPGSQAALAGLARAYVDAQTRIDALVAAGQDVGPWKDAAAATLIAVNGAGVEALDLALRSAVHSGDASTAGALCRVLGPLASQPTSGLGNALASQDGAMRSEAAVALGQIAMRSGQAASADVIGVLGQSAGREVLRIALVIDADSSRGGRIGDALRAHDAYATVVTSGAAGLVVLRRSPALDLVVVAESLPDITTAQIVDEVREDGRLAGVPVIVVTADKDATAAAYGEKIQGTSSGPEDLEAAKGPLTAEVQGDRALAHELAARSAQVLDGLARAGADLSAALSGLASATMRPDPTALPAISALGGAGGSSQALALLAVLTDGQRSDEARAAAGAALARVVARSGGQLEGDGVAKVLEVVESQAAPAVREAAARVLGCLSMSPAERARLLEKLRN